MMAAFRHYRNDDRCHEITMVKLKLRYFRSNATALELTKTVVKGAIDSRLQLPNVLIGIARMRGWLERPIRFQKRA